MSLLSVTCPNKHVVPLKLTVVARFAHLRPQTRRRVTPLATAGEAVRMEWAET